MLYTTRPLERVYADFISKERGKQQKDSCTKDAGINHGRENAEYREVNLPHGRVVTRREGNDYIVEKINSTDMSDYLNEEYSPGKIIKH
jgi:hypothetical protein